MFKRLAFLAFAVPALACAQPTAPTYYGTDGTLRTAQGTFGVQAAGLGVTPLATTAAASCLVLKNSAATLYSASGYAGAATWIMLFNSATAPADGTVTPAAVVYVAAAGSWSLAYGTPLSLSTGATVCASSTGPFTKTAVATNNYFTGQVK